MNNPSYEKLGLFYLGRLHDPSQGRTLEEPLLLESRHLTTHALAVGMTGSGKTGLCLSLIEEAAIDGIPALVIDPKGDLGNLLLTFPDLRPEDFARWVNEEDARRRGMTPADYAADQSTQWREGLAKWGQDGDRIRRLRAAADFAIYTPGSSAGLPVSILNSFAVPPPEILEDGESLRERVGALVSGLLGLVGLDADPVKSRESVLLTNLVQQAWARGRNLDLADLIREVQQPSVARIGILDLESFYPAKERFEFALRLNQLLASPSFSAWMEGTPLDAAQLLHTPSGKPRVAIFSIAHLGDAERMWFVTLLLNQVVSWMRTQSGTNSLRALVYMDEILGYFPPVANPPSKPPLLTLLKQGRAFGVGAVLATQNPVDLDYRGLANIGTWFIGQLQTDRDRARVLEGVATAVTDRGSRFDRATAEGLLAGLGRRVFFLRTVHEAEPAIFESRWALSYLRGPLSRSQIQSLMHPQHPSAVVPDAPTAAASQPDPACWSADAEVASARPVLPPEVPQFFAPARRLPPDGRLVYQPRLLGAAQVRYANSKLKIDLTREVVVATDISDKAVPVDWSTAEELELNLNQLERTGADAEFLPCAPPATAPSNYARWSKEFLTWLQTDRPLTLLQSPALRALSQPGETERAFRIRLQQLGREARDQATAELRRRYAPRIAALQERLRRAEAAAEREQGQAQRAKLDTVVALGSTLLGALFGRKAVSATTFGKAATTVRSAGRAADQASDVTRANETVEAVRRQLATLEAELEAELTAGVVDPTAARLEAVELRPSRGGVNLRLLALLWMPMSRDRTGTLHPAH